MQRMCHNAAPLGTFVELAGASASLAQKMAAETGLTHTPDSALCSCL